MPDVPRDWYWHVSDWKPTGKRAYEQVTNWRHGTYLALLIQETGVERHVSGSKGQTITRWRRANVSDISEHMLGVGE